MDIRIRRVYEPLQEDDGEAILIDRLWPRGVAKTRLAGVRWWKALAPSDALRTSFAHQPARWADFRRRYAAELDAMPDAITELRQLAARGRVTLLYAARDTAHNNAVALRDFLMHGAAGLQSRKP